MALSADRGVPARSAEGAAVLLSALLVFSASAGAFHDAGVASCSGCHSMHDSQDGVPVGGGLNPLLLTADSATDVCLSCHASSHGSVLGSDPLLPPPEIGAGNFTFLLEDNINDAVDGWTNPIGGHHAGHSVVSQTWGLLADPDYLNAPGGTFPSDELSCTSCHDPHGNSSFRMLRGAGDVLPGGFAFTYAAPQGEGVDDLVTPESPTNHTAYQSGWNDWCANCHGLYHDQTGQAFGHAEHALGTEWQYYNQYNGHSDPFGGNMSTAYVPEVPFEDAAMTSSSVTGPGGSSRVMCMSCHRAHATSAPAALRWDPNVLRLSDDGFVSLSYPLPDPYNETEQRALCVKCHYPDASPHGMNDPCLSCHGGGGPQPGILDY